MAKIKLEIDNKEVEVEKGKTVLQAAQSAGIYIPALCAHPDLPPAPGLKASSVIYLGGKPYHSSGHGMEFQGCRLCLVEVGGMKDIPTSCNLPAAEGMVVHTNTPRVQELRRENLKAILLKHPHACPTCKQREGCSPFESCPNSIPIKERCCSKLGYCELQAVVEFIGLKESIPRYIFKDLPIKKDEPLFTQDYSLCIGCTRCVRVCKDLRGIGALGFISRDDEIIAGPIASSLKESGCKFCGACVEVCPTGALLDLDIKRAERAAALVPCSNACPAGIDVPRYVRLTAEGKFAEAVAVVREKVPFPRVLGRVCFHPCEGVCRRGQLNQPIAICALKRFIAEQDTSQWQTKTRKASSTGKKVAIVGSGPAGLTAAYYLAKLGHSVKVFEALPEPGGMLRVGIPRYRLPKEVLDSEIEGIKSVGVEIKTNSKVESLDGLKQQGFKAVFLAIGAHQGMKMGIPGEDSPGVIECISFLKDVSQGKKVKLGDRVVVVGGGNAAIDAARTARRLGTKEVIIVYRRSRQEMPANPEEVEAALEEGIKILFLAAPIKITKDGNTLVIECLRMELGEPDASGRKRPVPIKGSEFNIACDTIIAAIGQMASVPAGFGSEPLAGGNIKVNSETLAAGIDGVFAGGDVATGPASVIKAIAAGRKAASSIDKYLGGGGDISEALAETGKASPWFGRDEGFANKHRERQPHLVVERRLSNFSEVELGFPKQRACDEAARCLRCDLRLDIAPVILPPSEWLEFNSANVDAAPEKDGVYRLFNEQKGVIYIGSNSNIRKGLQQVLNSGDDWVQKAKYLHFEETLMYTMRESELIQQYLQEHGKLPEGNEDLF
jgi:NADPH-dependent glutamate synthase beta subunit-like oxidoreductase/Pyruvate/2-oxoacid:ferredoxin oxidoreductase delta subunit